MATKFRNKYRIKSARLVGYDYSSNGAYFITICTKRKIPYFGEIIDNKMILSETGIIVKNFWLEIICHYPNICLDEFIIMPDHIHGIIIIKSKPESKMNCIIVETPNLGVSTGTTDRIAGTTDRISGTTDRISGTTDRIAGTTDRIAGTTDRIAGTTDRISGTTDRMGRTETPRLGVSTGNLYWKSNSIGSIINQFKRICTIKTKSFGLDLVWQPRYYDHIIHSEKELDRIRCYIRNNPDKWQNE
jgi:putative transposase